jgi:hypothetical protein
VATLLIHLGLAVFGGRPFPSFLGLVWWATGIGILFYYTAKSFHVVDIRFLPFMQIGLCLAGAVGLGSLLAMLPAPEIWPVVAALVVPFSVSKQVTFIPKWVKWNYSGFEQKGTYPTLKGITERLRGTPSDPRVVYEHSPDHEALGTIRVFENLPFFTGRSTLEGIYMQGSPSAPFVFYIQSEMSNVMSCPAEPRARCAASADDERLAIHREVGVHEGAGSQISRARARVDGRRLPDLPREGE